MKSIENFINENKIKEIFEELKTDDNSNYILKLERPEYNLYFHKHFLKRKSRHSEWDGQNYINDKSVIKLIEKSYKQIISKYNGNKLKYSKDGKEGFVVIDKHNIDNLCIVGFICDLDKHTAKYEICLKTTMYNDDFKAKDIDGFKTLPIIIENLGFIIVEKDE